MNEQTITVKELSEKIGLRRETLTVFLCRFNKYAINKDTDWIYKYKYNSSFLKELRQFFAKKMYNRKGQYFAKYHSVVENISNLLQTM